MSKKLRKIKIEEGLTIKDALEKVMGIPVALADLVEIVLVPVDKVTEPYMVFSTKTNAICVNMNSLLKNLGMEIGMETKTVTDNKKMINEGIMIA